MKLSASVDTTAIGYRIIAERSALATAARTHPFLRPPTHANPIGPPLPVRVTPDMATHRHLQVDRLLLAVSVLAADFGWPETAAGATALRTALLSEYADSTPTPIGTTTVWTQK